MSDPPAPPPLASTARPTPGAWAVHLLTALGAVLGFLAIVAVLDRRPLAAVVWLVAAQILDGFDGPLARAYGLDTTRSTIDGHTLDLVVDYLTCVAAPALLLHQFMGFERFEALLVVSAVLLSGALWFARTDMCTEDHCFRGFPAAWNLVIPTLMLLGLPTLADAVIVLGLSAMSFSNVLFVHPMRVVRGRAFTMGVTSLWLASLLALGLGLPWAGFELNTLLYGSSSAFAVVTAWQAWQARQSRQRLTISAGIA